MVVILTPASVPIGAWHERIAWPFSVHGAGAALGDAAAVLGAGQLQLVAQHPEQRRVGRGLDHDVLAVDVEGRRHDERFSAAPNLHDVKMIAGGMKVRPPERVCAQPPPIFGIRQTSLAVGQRVAPSASWWISPSMAMAMRRPT